MDSVRHVLGVILIIGVPPAVLFWLIIHPVAGFWRRMGAGITYVLVGGVCTGVAVGLFFFREAVLGTDLGTNTPLITLGILLYGVSAWLSILTKRQLSVRTFSGMPEVSGESSEGGLLQEGVYGTIRHPRYVSVIIGTAGFAMVVNHVGAYLMVLGSIPALLLVVFFEERELVDRFGAAYEEYRTRVPAFFPRFPMGSKEES
jgi:protein-S-isoprenylcysteine O-methyltransferase Ste14